MPSEHAQPHALKLGLLCNPLSGRAGQQQDALRRAAAAIPGVCYREAASRLDMVTALDDLSAEGVDVLGIIGGDGTVHAVLSHLFGMETSPVLPMLTVIPAGTTNMTAADLGIRGGPLTALARLGAQLNQPGFAARAESRSALRVEHAGLLLHGMFFGAGMIAEGVRFFLERVRGRGITGEKASALVMMRSLARLFTLQSGRERLAMTAGMSLDDGPINDDAYLLVFASTLQRLLLGMRPYWGGEAAPIHMTAITTAASGLWRRLPRIVTGRGGGLHSADGYRSRNVNAIEMHMDGDFALDGQLYRADRGQGPVRVSAAGPIRFLPI